MAFSSKTQGSIAQSSAEAELYAMASGVADAIFIKQLLSEIQEHIGIKTFDVPDLSSRLREFHPWRIQPTSSPKMFQHLL